MDAPQISTLKEDASPPPQQQSKPAIRSVKLLMKEEQPSPMHPFDLLAAAAAQSSSIPTAPSASTARKRRLSQVNNDEAAEDEDIEEDQLVDEEDLSAPKKRSPGKTKTKKEKTPTKLPKVTLNLSVPPAPSTAASSVASTDPQDSEPPTKKKKTAKKTKTAPGTPSKPAGPTGLKLKLLPPQLAEDNASVASEGYTGTAASSPVNAQFEPHSPLPDDVPIPALSQSQPSQEAAFPTREEDITASLEGVPIPSYPLPTKPFPVMPPPKLSSGLAPIIHFDKSRKKVRHWRTALREIRGIGGGRWFARTWVGDKESLYASSTGPTKGGYVESNTIHSSSASPEKSSGLSKLASVALGSSNPGIPSGVPPLVISSSGLGNSMVVPVSADSMHTHIPVSKSDPDIGPL